MKKSNTKSVKTTESPKPETTIEADIHVTFILNDTLTKNEAEDLIKDVTGDFDNVEIKNLKTFVRGI